MTADSTSGKDRLGPYEVLGLLGAGGMGEVFRARDTVLGREVALKALPAELAADPLQAARFDREARLLAALNHPNIAAIYNVTEGDLRGEGSQRFLVLELVPGEDLRRRLKGDRVPTEEALRIAGQIARALEAAHQKGIVHRDLKPANIIVTPEGDVKVLDFGIAKPPLASDVGSEDTTVTTWDRPWKAGLATSQSLTTPGAMVGTLPYMSPEQVRGADVDERADIWAFGCVLYEILTGARAFPGKTAPDTIASILEVEPDLARLPPGTPPAVAPLLERCLRKDADRRLASIRDARLALEDAQGAAAQEAAPVQPSIAVLPFANLSGDPDNQYFSDGLAEELINGLMQLPGLQVASRTSAFRFRDRELDIREIGDKLGVSTVLEGSVRRAGNRLRVTAHLTKVNDGYSIWSERYDRQMEDVFAIQDEITEAMVLALKPTLLGRHEKGVKRHTRDLEAYELYLKGRYLWQHRTADALRAGIECFQQAIERDPGYALAYTGVADSFAVLRVYGYVSSDQGRPHARSASEKALALDPALAEAHLSAGMVHIYYEEEWREAEAHFRKAIDINPRSSLAQGYFGIFLAAQNRFDEAVTQVQISRELDPFSPFVHALAGLALYTCRRYDEAMEASQRALDLQPEFPLGLWGLGASLCKKLRYGQAIDVFERLLTPTKRGSLFLGLLGLAYGLAGRREEAKNIIQELEERGQSGYVYPHGLLGACLGLGDRDAIYEALKRCVEDRTTTVGIWVTIGPLLDPLFEEERFRKLFARLRAPSPPAAAPD